MFNVLIGVHNLMLILNAFVDCFWLTASEAVKLFVPIVAIVILFKLLHYFILGGR